MIHTDHPDAVALAKRAFPDYRGKKFGIVVHNGDSPLNVKSYWSGGSRSYFKFVRIDGQKGTVDMPQQSMFDKQVQGAEAVQLQPGLACIEHVIFCGKDHGIRIHVHPDNAPRLLPKVSEVSLDERIVLVATRSYKNTYGGQTNLRFKEASQWTGITRERWEAAKTLCIDKKLLKANGSLTLDGKNAAQGNLHNL